MTFNAVEIYQTEAANVNCKRSLMKKKAESKLMNLGIINSILQNQFNSICFGDDQDFGQHLSEIKSDVPVAEDNNNIVISMQVIINKHYHGDRSTFAHGADCIEFTGRGKLVMYKMLPRDCSLYQLLEFMYCLGENWKEGIFIKQIKHDGKISVLGQEYLHYVLDWSL